MFQVRFNGEKPRYVDGLEIELACDDCKRLYRRQGMTVKRVLHRFNVLGECTETVIVRAGR